MENNSWKKLYTLAAEFYRLEPWKYVMESDVFGVEIPGTKKTYFISIMGSAGVMPGLAAYEGASSLAAFWDMNGAENPDTSDLLSIPHLIMSFEEENDTDPEQMKRIRSLGLQKDFPGIYPEFRHNIPGIYPYAPSEELMPELLVILEQTLEVVKEAKDNIDVILPEEFDEDVYLIRTPVSLSGTTPVSLSGVEGDGATHVSLSGVEGGRVPKPVSRQPFDSAQGDFDSAQGDKWTNEYRPVVTTEESYDFKIPTEDLDAVISLPVTIAAMQAHCQLLPLQVEHNGKIYFSFICILVNKRSGRVENVDTMIADPDYHTMLEKIPGVFMKFIQSLGFRPRVIEVKSDLLFDLLKDPLQKCGIRLNKYKELTAVTEAVNGILEYSKNSRE